ncbi:RNA polymerase sigma factor [Algoriphagus formosus]|uniref:RNA polymerase sigma factor n=1 Tax=Algoriphagus formosus TaxID=2007308 RepID=UPI003F717823
MSAAKEIEKEFISRIEKHQGIIHKICFVYAKNESDRKDLYQEIILQLWKSYPGFKGNSSFSTWMYRVALNTAITQNKKPKLLLLKTEVSPEIDDRVSKMEASEDIKVLYEAISHLNKIEKAIILLWLDEKSYDEIAETIGISVKNVSVKLVRIKSKLAQLIQKLQ